MSALFQLRTRECRGSFPPQLRISLGGEGIRSCTQQLLPQCRRNDSALGGGDSCSQHWWWKQIPEMQSKKISCCHAHLLQLDQVNLENQLLYQKLIPSLLVWFTSVLCFVLVTSKPLISASSKICFIIISTALTMSVHHISLPLFFFYFCYYLLKID